MSKRNALVVAAMVTTAGLYSSAFATPYASTITESSGTVSFVLNEDATDVTIIRDGVSTSLGALTKGTQTFTRDAAANYQIVVSKTSGDGYQNATGAAAVAAQPAGTLSGGLQQISSDTNASLRFNSPRGVTNNRNASTPALFGRTYVSNTAAGTLAVSGSFPTRTLGDGLYLLRADQTDAIGQGDTALTAGLDSTFTAGGASSPFKVSLDDEGYVYIGDPTTASGSVYRADPNLSAGSGVNLLTGVGSATAIAPTATLNHGGVYAPVVSGSASAGTLTLFTDDQDLNPSTAAAASELNSLWRYDLGSTTSAYAGIPTQLMKKTIIPNVVNAPENDLTRGPDGKFYQMQNRSAGTAEAGIFVLSSDGTKQLFNSYAESVNLGLDADTTVAGVQDVIRQVRGVSIRSDGHYMGLVTDDSNAYVIPLIDGIPDIANRTYIDTFGTNNTTFGRDADFDAAGNLYVTGSGTGAMRIFAPGTISQTIFNSNGTFTTITEPSFNGAGNLSDSTHWLLGATANSNDAVASIGNLDSGTRAITVDAPTALARIRFVGGTYTLSGTNTITMGAGTSEPRILAEAGTQTISAPLSIQKNFGVAAYTGATLNLTNVAYTSNTLNITKWSAGTVAMPAFNQRKLDLKAGTLRFNSATAAGAAKVSILQVAGLVPSSMNVTTSVVTPTSGTPTATLDLGATGIVLDYAPLTGAAVSPLSDVNYLLASGRTGAPGIISSKTATDGRLAVAATEATSLKGLLTAGVGTFMGQAVDDTSVLVRTLLKGDANFDGSVGFADLVILAQNYGGTDKVFTSGDFNFDGKTDFSDLVSVAQNYNATYTDAGSIVLGDSSAFAADWALAQSIAPEPTSLALLGLGGLALVRRRK